MLRVGVSSILLSIVASAASAQTALDDYVARTDPNTSWSVADSDDGLFADTYLLHLVSQQWRSAAEVDRPVWRHELIVAEPNFDLCGDSNSPETAVLLINGGHNPFDDKLRKADAEAAQLAASTFCSVVALLNQVPNQPLNFSDEINRPRSEDAIIAYSFNKFLETGDTDWPVYMAMTKSAVAAMDAVREFSRSGRGVTDIDDFIVMGGSKRGWTTWLAAAVDQRVKAIVPISIDMLNLGRQFSHHWQTYGFYTPAVNDYAGYDLGCRLQTEAGRKLLDLVDPYSYRHRYTMPKLIINSSGDQFFASDSTRFYYDDLPEPKALRYTANTDHAQGEITDVLTLLLNTRSWIDDIDDGQVPPDIDWRFESDGSIVVQPSEKPGRVRLWQAHNPNARDFRLETIGRAWRSTRLRDNGGGRYVGKVSEPAFGYTAYFIEVTFDEGGELEADQVVSSGVRVVPDTLPYAGSDCPLLQDYTNLWWDPPLSGQGIQLLQQGSRLDGAWYLYDQNGVGRWLSFVGQLDAAGSTATGKLLRFTGPELGKHWNSRLVTGFDAGEATLSFRSSSSATFRYRLDGMPGQLELVPFDRLANSKFTGIWFDPAQEGQGVQLVHRESRLSGAWYLYDEQGRGMWLTFSGEVEDGAMSSDLRQFTGPPFAEAWAVDTVDSEVAGSVRIELLDASSVRFGYTVKGSSSHLDLLPFTLH